MAVNYASDSPADDDRRAMPRAATRRRATFSAPAGGPFSRGTVVDLSPNGLCIHTHQPLAAGSAIEIEVAPRAATQDDVAMLVRGDVMRVDAVDDRIHAMGIQLRVRLPAVGNPSALFDRESATAMLQQLRQAMTDAPTAGGGAAEWNSTAERAAAEVRFRATPRRRRWPWVLGAALVLALLALAGWLAWWTVRDGVPSSGDGASSAWRYVRTTTESMPLPVTLGSEAHAAMMAQLESTTPPLIGLEASAQLLDAGLPEAALPAYQLLAGRTDATPQQRAQAALGMAAAATAAGDRATAEAAVTRAAAALPDLPELWQRVVADWRRAIDTKATMPPRMTPRLGLGVATATGPADATEERRIVVSTEAFVLTVYAGDRVLGTYPVGLGFNDATPVGQFTIANKIEEPDWYNRGKVVRSGDPANPLGDYWMGLGVGGRATPYGIHPTTEAASIGAKQSAGCIRMRPADAAAVFELCRVGTPVTVGP